MEAAPDALAGPDGPSVAVRAAKDIAFGSVRHFWYPLSFPVLTGSTGFFSLCLFLDRRNDCKSV